MTKLRFDFTYGSFVFFLFLMGCTGASSGNSQSSSDTLYIESTIEKANLALSRGDCASAYAQIHSLYDSSSSNNAIRAVMASTYGCYATINVFAVLSDLVSFSGGLSGSGFFQFVAQEFPSTTDPVDDKIPQAAENGIDSVMSMLNPASIVITSDIINSTSHNPGSLLYTDRIDDANSYLMFLTMSELGALGNRYGSPDAEFHKTNDLPWITAALTKGDGCAYAAALLNFKDSIKFLSSVASGSVGNAYNTMQEFLGVAVDTACSLGCALCGGSVSCTVCPVSLRDRSSCTGLTTDTNSCAAAGIIQFVNSSWTDAS